MVPVRGAHVLRVVVPGATPDHAVGRRSDQLPMWIRPDQASRLQTCPRLGKKPCPGIGMGRDGQGRVVGSLQLRRVDRPGLVNAASAR